MVDTTKEKSSKELVNELYNLTQNTRGCVYLLQKALIYKPSKSL